MRAAMPVVHEAHTAGTSDADGYTVPEGWADGVNRLVFGWEPEHLDVQVQAGYQMRVSNRQQIMVPDIRLYGPNDHLVLGKTASTVTVDDDRMRVDEIRDYSHGPFGAGAFGPAPGVLVVEKISG